MGAEPFQGWDGLCPKCLVRVSLEVPEPASTPRVSPRRFLVILAGVPGSKTEQDLNR